MDQQFMNQIQPLLYMALSNNDFMKNNASFLILLLPFLLKLIPFKDIYDYFLKIVKYNKEKQIIISSLNQFVSLKNRSINIYMCILNCIQKEELRMKIPYLYKDFNLNLQSKNLILIQDEYSVTKNVYLSLNQKIKISDEIYIEMIEKEKIIVDILNKDETEKVKQKYYEIILSTPYKNNISILDNFMNDCIDVNNNYDKENHKKNIDLYIYEYKEYEKKITSSLDNNNNRNYILKFNIYTLNHNKDLIKNVFIDGKDELLTYIDPFIYNENIENKEIEKYNILGIPYRAGLLFHGSPGCGKTSTIKAILKYTNRHCIMINLSKIKTCNELEILFRNPLLLVNSNIKKNQLCYVLEDCDAFENNFILSRKNNKNNDDDSNHSETTLDEMSEKFKKIFHNKTNETNLIQKTEEEKDIENDKVNLSCFLNILDGIIDIDGIMIIMTTNHPEKIDPALLRPGRFSFMYEFKRSSVKIVLEMFQTMYALTEDEMENCKNLLKIRDEEYSPAEIQAIFFRNKNYIDSIHTLNQHIQFQF